MSVRPAHVILLFILAMCIQYIAMSLGFQNWLAVQKFTEWHISFLKAPVAPIKISTTERESIISGPWKWREKATKSAFCSENETKEQLLKQPQNLDQIIVDDKHKMLFCFIPKVACTNWKKVMVTYSDVMICF